MTVRLEPIHDDDVPDVARFLHSDLNPRVSVEQWESAMRRQFAPDPPNFGLALRDDRQVVGSLLAFYSVRQIAGRQERFCNLGAWCVRPEQRFRGLQLLRGLLRQEDYHFTDLSPSGATILVNERLGFQRIDTTTSLLPFTPSSHRGLAWSEDVDLERHLTSRERTLYHDHREAAAAHHVLLRDEQGDCYVIYRRDRRKNLPLFASVLHVSDKAHFQRLAPALGSHVLRKHRVGALLLEHRTTGVPAGAIRLRKSRPKMYKSSRLHESQIDNLYSELCTVPW